MPGLHGQPPPNNPIPDRILNVLVDKAISLTGQIDLALDYDRNPDSEQDTLYYLHFALMQSLDRIHRLCNVYGMQIARR